MKKDSRAATWLGITFGLIFFFVSVIGGELLKLNKDGLCFKFFGCNNGFFGFDGWSHFLAGLACASLAILLFKKYPHLNILQAGNKTFWKNVIIILAIIALIGIVWEGVEFTYDHLRLLAGINLYNPYDFAQPTNIDTMGDLLLSLLDTVSAAATGSGMFV
jgi:hypothetical protein